MWACVGAWRKYFGGFVGRCVSLEPSIRFYHVCWGPCMRVDDARIRVLRFQLIPLCSVDDSGVKRKLPFQPPDGESKYVACVRSFISITFFLQKSM